MRGPNRGRGVSSLPSEGSEEAHAAGAGARGRSQAGGEPRLGEPPAGAPRGAMRRGGADFERAKATVYGPTAADAMKTPQRRAGGASFSNPRR